MDYEGISDGYIERKAGGRYEGEITFAGGINLSPIEAQYFKRDEDGYLWIKRKPLLEYDQKTMSYKQRERIPKWECYLKKSQEDVVAYRGEFVFMRVRFTIAGVWDTVLGMDKKQRLNLFVERMPKEKQTIINNINERKRNEKRG